MWRFYLAPAKRARESRNLYIVFKVQSEGLVSEECHFYTDLAYRTPKYNIMDVLYSKPGSLITMFISRGIN